MEAKIDITKVIDRYGLNKKEVALRLFPGNSRPDAALNRLISGEGSIYLKQVQALAEMARIKITDLLQSKWSSKAEENLIVFSSPGYRAELNRDTWLTRVYADGELCSETVITGPNCTISEYIIALDGLITNIKHQNYE